MSQLDECQKKIDKLEQVNYKLSNPENYGDISKTFPFKRLDANQFLISDIAVHPK